MDKYTKIRLAMTEKEEKKYIKELQKQFKLSYTNIRFLLANFINTFGVNGKLSKNAFQYNRFENLLKSVGEKLREIKNLKFQTMNAHIVKMQQMNYLYTGFALEKTHGIPFNFNPLKTEDLGMSKLSKLALSIKNKELFQNLERTITQSIVKSDGVGETAKAIRGVLNNDLSKSLRIARTETTGAMNAYNLKGMERVRDKGLKIKKQWVSTLDKKTRRSHGKLDGEQVDIDKKYSNGLMFPADPSGKAEEVINCRCVQMEVLDKQQDKYKALQRRAREDGFNKVIQNTNYEDWKDNL